jgi:uncharacterized protein YdeI (YjbR/CyaY-like superfamily)
MTKPNPKLDPFFRTARNWRAEFQRLRKIALGAGLTEELKWRLPCYTLDGANIAIIQGFKEYCALMFFKGALLKDPKGILVAPGQSQAGRQARFTGVREIIKMEPVLTSYIKEAIGLENAGLKVELKKTSEFAVPPELQRRLDQHPALKSAFRALTPGRQRAYLFYFAQAKQPATREARIERFVPQILRGKGLNDR